jgi:Flp pilus assembly protein CpaB
MRRGRIFFYLALLLLLGLVAFVFIYQKFLSPTARTQPQVSAPTAVVDVVNVIVVTQNVPRGNAITRDVLSLVPIQRELFIQSMFTNIRDVEGKLAKFDLDAGIPLTANMLADSAEGLSGAGSLAALAIPRGMVAVAIPLNRLSNSYPLKAGDHVNLIVTMKFVDIDTEYQSILPNQVSEMIAPGTNPESNRAVVSSSILRDAYSVTSVIGRSEIISGFGFPVYSIPSESQRPRLVSQSLLQNAFILSIGNYMSFLAGKDEEKQKPTQEAEQPAQAEQAQGTPTPEPPKFDFLSLVVTPQDAITLNYLLMSGAELTLVLRNTEDDTRVQTQAVTLQYLLNQYNIPVPVRLPYSSQPRVDDVVPPSFLPAPVSGTGE